MLFRNLEGMEYVRPSNGRSGYFRRSPDRSNPTPAQKAAREAFGKKASGTRGKTGTVVLPDGRRISLSAYQIMIMKNNAQPAPKNQLQIKMNNQAYKGLQLAQKGMSADDLLEAIIIQNAVGRGEVTQEWARRWAMKNLRVRERQTVTIQTPWL